LGGKRRGLKAAVFARLQAKALSVALHRRREINSLMV
jgi:hypothetical protein